MMIIFLILVIMGVTGAWLYREDNWSLALFLFVIILNTIELTGTYLAANPDVYEKVKINHEKSLW